jgi:hypothetical protein
VRLTVSPTSGKPDLDVGLRILDSSGEEIAALDPAVHSAWGKASGLDATWVARLPRLPASYTALVDGVGTGSPLTTGRYSDYGSLGAYRITLSVR